MKVVILAGGFGTRILEESHLRPKPMIEIGGKPILWHIMKHFAHFGHHDFIICAGYKQHIIKEYFADYYLHNADVTFDLRMNSVTVHQNYAEPWTVTVVDTGLQTMTGGRVNRIQKYVGTAPFLLTYGDGVADVDIDALLTFHQKENAVATLTAVRPQGRFGVLDLRDTKVEMFREKDQKDMGYINGGFMVLSPEIFNFLQDDTTILEREPLQQLAAYGMLCAYRHNGFWQCMDTKRDHEQLEALWLSGDAPWKVWKD